MKVADVMTSDVITVRPEISIKFHPDWCRSTFATATSPSQARST
jgi:hypothetical protein